MPETTLLAVSGLALDRAWPDLGPERGSQRRVQARDALVRLAGAARRGPHALVIAGGLLDRRSVEPTTVDLLTRLFEAIAVPVVIAPGALDWYSEDSPLATTDWPSNVRIVRDPSGEAVELSTGLMVWACAVTSPLNPTLSVPGPGHTGAAGHVAVVPAATVVDERDLDSAGIAHALVAVPDLSTWTARVTTTGHAVPVVIGGTSPSCAVSLRLDAEGRLVSREPVPLAVPALPLVEVDAGACATSEELRAAVQQAADEGAAAVRLTGLLRPGVLLPHLLGQAPSDVDVDSTGVEHDLGLPPQEDLTAAAEFLRDLAERPEPVTERHQAAALGLLALDSARAAGGS